MINGRQYYYNRRLKYDRSGNSNFYSPEEYRDKRSGSNYNFNIGNSIIQILSKHEKLGYNNLRAKVENLLGNL